MQTNRQHGHGAKTPRKNKKQSTPYQGLQLTPEGVQAMRAAGWLLPTRFEPVPDFRPPGAPTAQWHAPMPETSAPGVPSVSEWHDASNDEIETTYVVRSHYNLVFENGTVIPVSGNMTIGRQPQASEGEATVSIIDPSRLLSRSHARIYRGITGRLQLVDLGSANGTEILHDNGQRVELEPHKRYPLNPDDLILLGETSIRVTANTLTIRGKHAMPAAVTGSPSPQ